jgi:UDP-N-acetyl-D-glucosamine dehydrogenase
MNSVEITKENLKKYDLVVLSTDHTDYDYKLIADNAKLIIDTRNAFGKRGFSDGGIVKG